MKTPEIATIEMYEPLVEHKKIVAKRGKAKPFVFVAKFGPVAKVCPSEMSAARYLEKMGFRLNDNVEWVRIKKSVDELNLEKWYRIHPSSLSRAGVTQNR